MFCGNCFAENNNESKECVKCRRPFIDRPSRERVFLVEKSDNKKEWLEAFKDSDYFTAGRDARTLSKDGRYYRITNLETKNILVMHKDGMSIPKEEW